MNGLRDPILRAPILRSLLVLSAAVVMLATVAGMPTATQAAPNGNRFPIPMPGGFTQGVAGTTDPAALAAGQPFEVDAIFQWDIATQSWLLYVPDAPAFVSTLSQQNLRVDSFVSVRRNSVATLRGAAVASTVAAPTQPQALAAPPGAGLTVGFAGTTDPDEFVRAQSFETEVLFVWSVNSQSWLLFAPGAPSFVNTLSATSLKRDSIVWAKTSGAPSTSNVSLAGAAGAPPLAGSVSAPTNTTSEIKPTNPGSSLPPSSGGSSTPGKPNKPPKAINDHASATSNLAVKVSVLANDSDPDGDALTVLSHTQGANGAVTGGGDGTLVYKPAAEFTGDDFFTYKVSDGRGGTASATVSLTVAATAVQNQAPVAQDDDATTMESIAVKIAVLSNDSDPDGDSLSISNFTQAANGAVSDNGDGTLNYKPTIGFVGTDSFTYEVADGRGGAASATVSATVQASPNQLPVALDDSYIVPQDSALSKNADAGVLSNDSDGNGDTLTATVVTGVANGTLSLAADGSFTYTPDAGFSGADSFGYKATDGKGGADTALVSISVTAKVNRAPAAQADDYLVVQGSSLTRTANTGVLANDTDADGDTLTAQLVTGVSNGTLSLTADGSFTYTPNASFSGTDSFSYKASDGTAVSSAATVTIAVAAPSTRTTAGLVALYDFAERSGTKVHDVSGAGTPQDLDILNASAVQWLPGMNGVQFTTTTSAIRSPGPANDIRTGIGGSDLTLEAWLTPANLSQSGPVRIATISGGTSQGEMNVHLGQQGGSASFRLRTNTNMFSKLELPAFKSTTQARHMVLTYDGAVKRIYVDGILQSSFENLTGSFTNWNIAYGLIIGNEASLDRGYLGKVYLVAVYDRALSQSAVQLNFAAGPGAGVPAPPPPPPNDPPVATDDTGATTEGQAVTIKVLLNDSDPNGNPLAATAVTQGANGAVTTNGTAVTYTPDTGFFGQDSFTYQVSDGKGGADWGGVTVTVSPLGIQPPVTVADYYATSMGTTLTRNASQGVLANDSDPNGDPITARVVSTTLNGALSLNADGSFTYTPNAGFSGKDTFSYVANDGTIDSSQMIATISVVDGSASDMWVTGWYPGWFQNKLPPSEIDYEVITHVSHFMITVNGDGSLGAIGRPGFKSAAEIAGVVNTVHANGRKVLVTVGGAGNHAGFASAIQPANRATLVNNLVNFVTTHNYDGADIDMEPVRSGDYANFKQFNIDLRAALDAVDPNLMQIVAAGPAQPICEIWQVFDQINLMTYDMSGAWSGWVTWHNAPIYNGGLTFPSVPTRELPSANQRIDQFIAAGYPANRLSIGFDSHGYEWRGGTGTDTGGVTRPYQSWSSAPQVLANRLYNDLAKYYDLSTAKWDPVAQAAYISVDNPGSADDRFISIDNEQTAQAKVNYVRTKGLGGLGVWELYGSYFPERPAGQRDPLLNAIKAAVQGGP